MTYYETLALPKSELYIHNLWRSISIHQKWETDGQSKHINANEVTRTGNGKIQSNIEGLNPGATYTVRLRVLAEGSKTDAGKASPELIIDTEAVSCTPKPSCMILWSVWENNIFYLFETWQLFASEWE